MKFLLAKLYPVFLYAFVLILMLAIIAYLFTSPFFKAAKGK